MLINVGSIYYASWVCSKNCANQKYTGPKIHISSYRCKDRIDSISIK